jgi:hypothetical protein
MAQTLGQTFAFDNLSSGKLCPGVPKHIGVIPAQVTCQTERFAYCGFCLPNFSGIVGPMAERQWERLGKAVLERRTSKGWTQQEVWEQGGPSDSLQTDIEQLRWQPTRNPRETLKKIDNGLDWVPGSADRVTKGGDPIEIEPFDVSAVASAEGTLSAGVRGYINPTRDQLGELQDAQTQLSYGLLLLATNQPAQGVAMLTGARAIIDAAIRALQAPQSPQPATTSESPASSPGDKDEKKSDQAKNPRPARPVAGVFKPSQDPTVGTVEGSENR